MGHSPETQSTLRFSISSLESPREIQPSTLQCLGCKVQKSDFGISGDGECYFCCKGVSCVYIYIHSTYIYIYMCTHTCIYMYTYIYTHIVCVYIYTLYIHGYIGIIIVTDQKKMTGPNLLSSIRWGCWKPLCFTPFLTRVKNDKKPEQTTVNLQSAPTSKKGTLWIHPESVLQSSGRSMTGWWRSMGPSCLLKIALRRAPSTVRWGLNG